VRLSTAGSIRAGVAGHDDIKHSRAGALGEAGPQRLTEPVRILYPDPVAAHRAGDCGIIHLDEVGGLITPAKDGVLQCLYVTGGGMLTTTIVSPMPARRAVSSSPSIMLKPPSPVIATAGMDGAAKAAPIPPGSP